MFVLVNGVDLAVLEALRYGRGLARRRSDRRAFHDRRRGRRAAAQALGVLRHRDAAADHRLPRPADRPAPRRNWCPTARAEYRNTNVTVLLPRRSYAPLLGRLLHDRTADKIARAISRIPDAAATIVPYDVQSRIRQAFPDLFEERVTRELEKVQSRMAQRDQERVDDVRAPRCAAERHRGGRPAPGTPGHRRRAGQRGRRLRRDRPDT